MRNIFILAFVAISTLMSAQTYGIRFVKTGINCTTKQVCYDVQLRSTNGTAVSMAGQNYRLFYDTNLMHYASGTSYLPQPNYTPFTLVQVLEDNDASAFGSLPFDADLGFLNYFMDFNNTDDITQATILPADGSWVSTSNLCFTVDQKVFDNPSTYCLEAVWGREGMTDGYATAFVHVSYMIANNSAGGMTGTEYLDLNQTNNGNDACVGFLCQVAGVTVADVSVNENAGTATVQVCISEALTSNATVVLNTSNGTATAGSDYTAVTSQTVTIPAGSTCTNVTIPILNDSLAEGNETFTVTLTSPSTNVTLADPTATVTILDDEAACSALAPTISGN